MIMQNKDIFFHFYSSCFVFFQFEERKKEAKKERRTFF